MKTDSEPRATICQLLHQWYFLFTELSQTVINNLIFCYLTAKGDRRVSPTDCQNSTSSSYSCSSYLPQQPVQPAVQSASQLWKEINQQPRIDNIKAHNEHDRMRTKKNCKNLYINNAIKQVGETKLKTKICLEKRRFPSTYAASRWCSKSFKLKSSQRKAQTMPTNSQLLCKFLCKKILLSSFATHNFVFDLITFAA